MEKQKVNNMMNMSKLYTWIASVVILFSLPTLCGCSDSDDVGDSYSTFRGLSVADYLDEHADSLSEFTAALKSAGIYSLLQATGKYTCFIPNNAAMKTYYAEKGITSYADMSQKDLKEFVCYHLLDGETNGTKAYTTQDFSGTSLPDQNMTGRYITTDLDTKTAYWILNKTSLDIHPDITSETDEEGNEKDIVNGVIHIINRVMEGSNDLLPDYISNQSDFSLFYQALKATSLADSLAAIEDDSYEQPTTAPDGTDLTGNTSWQYPEKRLYGFTALAEPDSIYKQKAGITTLDELRDYAKKIYDPLYPDAANITDETNPENSLYRFVAYHLLDKKVPISKLVHTYGWISEYTWFDQQRKSDICYDGAYTIEEYHVAMSNNLIYMQKKGTDGSIAINSTGNVFSDADLFSNDQTIQFISAKSDQECKNGMLHAINNILVYDSNMKNKVLHRRLRLEFQTFLPELTTNSISSYVNKYGRWNRYIPSGYCKNITFTEKRPSVYMYYSAANVHPYLWGDELVGMGFFDVTIKVKAIPAGKYEIRFGYHCNTTAGGVTQIYFDGQPCGIPINMAQSATAGAVGWACDYEIYGLSNYSPPAWSDSEDPQGLENDKTLRNHGFMKGPDSYTGTVYHNNIEDTYVTARNTDIDLRRILGIFNFTSDGDHTIEFVQMKSGKCEFDYIEFMPVDLLDKEDRH